MSVVENTKLDPALNYRTLQSTRPYHQYRKVYPANGGSQTVALPASGALQQVIFNIPAECINMGESYLEYQYVIDATAGKYSWIYRDVHGEFDSLMYRDTGSMAIVDVKNLHLYNQLTNRLNYSSDQLEYNDNLNGLVATNAPLTDVKCVRFDNSTCSLAFKEPQQMSLVSGLNAQSSVQYKKIYLKDLIKDSWFGLAKNQIMPIETYLEIQLGNLAGRIGFCSDSAVLPNATPVALGAITISNLQLNLAVEQNQELVKMLKAEVSKGVSVPIPWARVHQLASTAGTNFVYNLPLDNKQHGQRLKRIIYAPILASGSAHQVYDHTNLNGARISLYQTELDNQKMQRDQIAVSASRNDDYMYHRKFLNKHTLYFNQPIYNQNWIHCDSWDYAELHDPSGSGAIMVDGLLLDKPMTWSFISYTNAGVSFLNTAVVVGQKMLAINASSFVVA